MKFSTSKATSVSNRDCFKKAVQATKRPQTKPFRLPVTLHPKQREFVDDDRLEVLFGGACGGGKSLAQLASALKFVHVPGYAALLIRRSYSHLTMPGGLIPVASEWLGGKATYSTATFTWTFPSGATLSFGYLDNDRDLDKYQGAQLQYIGVDEACQIPETRYRYLFSRLRKPDDLDVPLRFRASSNPGGISHNFIKQRFLIEGEDAGRLFIPALLQDNPSLDREEYLKTLSELDPLTRARLLDGDWDALPEGGMFQRDWFQIIQPHEVPRDIKLSRFWDRAATAPKEGTDPDWTAGALVGLRKGIWYVVDLQHFRASSQGNETRIKQISDSDGKRVPIFMEQEPGSSGKDVIDYYARYVLTGRTFKGKRATGNKAERAAPVASAAELGNVKLVQGPWVTAFLDEAAAFPMAPHDDMVDAVSGAFSVCHDRPFIVRSIHIRGL
jgi:predicted phage terminase large subunit-like protein